MTKMPVVPSYWFVKRCVEYSKYRHRDPAKAKEIHENIAQYLANKYDNRLDKNQRIKKTEKWERIWREWDDKLKIVTEKHYKEEDYKKVNFHSIGWNIARQITIDANSIRQRQEVTA